MKRFAGVLLSALIVSAAGVAQAQSFDLQPNWMPATSTYWLLMGEDDFEKAEKKAEERTSFHQLDVKYRRLSVPESVIGIFYQQQTRVNGQAIAADYTIVKRTGFNVIISADYSEVQNEPGPWQEKGTNKDTDWTEIDLQFISADVTAAYELSLPGPISIVFGTGLGFGLVTGDVITYDDPNGPVGQRTEEDYPTILPVLNFQISPRVVLLRHLVLQVDVGFRNALFGGAAAGFRF